MNIRLIRHATLVLDLNGTRILVDPMLNPAGTVEAVPDTPNQRRNPLVDLPFGEDELARVLEEIDAVLVTHTHQDHWDERATELLPKDLQVLCQPEDEELIRSAGFSEVTPVRTEVEWGGTIFTRTGGQHGTGEIGEKMAPVSGFVLRSAEAPSLYIAGDTVWCPEVEEALSSYTPDVVVLNAGAARFLSGDPITMTAEDVAQVSRAVPDARILAVHME
ncbi:MAG: MBL fold metallo-hydrolase, partial [Rubrobacteraceae bacterium]